MTTEPQPTPTPTPTPEREGPFAAREIFGTFDAQHGSTYFIATDPVTGIGCTGHASRGWAEADAKALNAAYAAGRASLAAEVERLKAALTAANERARVLEEALKRAINYKDSAVLLEDNWNPDYPVEVMLTVGECKAIAAALAQPRTEGGGA